MDLAPTQSRTQTHPSTASTPVRGEKPQADAVDPQADDKRGLEEGEVDDPSLGKGADATLPDPGADTGGETGEPLF